MSYFSNVMLSAAAKLVIFSYQVLVLLIHIISKENTGNANPSKLLLQKELIVCSDYLTSMFVLCVQFSPGFHNIE